MNKYPYTNYQDLNLDWVLGVAADMRALTIPVDANDSDAYNKLKERGALATMVYTQRGTSVLLRPCTYDQTGNETPTLIFSSVYADDGGAYVLYVAINSTGQIYVNEITLGGGGNE